MTEWTVSADNEGQRVDAWLAARPEVGSRARAREWIERGKVFLNGAELTFDRAGTRLQAGDTVGVWPDRPGSSRPRSRDLVTRRSALQVVFEDAALLVADKPAGMLVEPLPGARDEITLRDLVGDHLRGARPYSRPPAGEALVVHRIDRDTTGLVLFAKNERARVALKRQFEGRTAERTYLAVLSGHITEQVGTWTDMLVWDKARLVQRRAGSTPEAAAKRAILTYRVLEQFDDAALVEVRLVTGKRNQIRVQARLHHHPLVGERIYTVTPRAGKFDARTSRAKAADFPRQALHAARLAFRHPTTGARVEFTASLPADLARLLQTLRARHRLA